MFKGESVSNRDSGTTESFRFFGLIRNGSRTLSSFLKTLPRPRFTVTPVKLVRGGNGVNLQETITPNLVSDL